MTLQDIQSVQEHHPGYLLNGSLSVPEDPENGHYQMIQAWIALGNTPAPAKVQYAQGDVSDELLDYQGLSTVINSTMEELI